MDRAELLLEDATRTGLRPARHAPIPSPGITPPGFGAFAGKPVLRPGVLVIGASTGGPQALIALIQRLTTALPHLPVCVTLHMPHDLMPIVASHVTRQCRVSTKVIEAPTPLRNGIIYFAPGDRHLDFKRKADGVELSLLPAVPGDYCKPAIDRMFAGAARVFGSRTIGVVLSGMGEDGLAGAHEIAAAGGILLVQDKASSAVWGMPGAVSKAGLAAIALPPEAIAFQVVRRLHLSGVLT